jgi:hypothetical protein
MALQQITIEIPDKALLAVKTDAESFGREIYMLGVGQIAAMALPLGARLPSHSHLTMVGEAPAKHTAISWYFPFLQTQDILRW